MGKRHLLCATFIRDIAGHAKGIEALINSLPISISDNNLLILGIRKIMNKFLIVLLLSTSGLLLAACSPKVTDPPASQPDPPVVKTTHAARLWKDVDSSFVH